MDPALVAGLRRYVRQPPRSQPPPDGGARCELCPISLPAEHKHLLDLDERRIVCVCPTCWSMRSGDARYRPTGSRTVWLEGLQLPDDLWAEFQIPIGLAFFLRSSATGSVVALYPSPAGATESELDLEAWARLVALNPVLEDLDADAEALIVNRMATPHIHAIAPLDDCYRLVGIIKATWEGISGGAVMESAVQRYFDDLRDRGGRAMTQATAPTTLEFTVLGAEPLEHTATPGVRFHLHITEPDGRDVYTIALTTQIQIDPARRSYDADTRARLVELFGAPERWGATTHALQWTRIEALVPSFAGSTTFTLEVPCTYDLEVAASKYFHSLPGGEVPLSFHFNGTVLYSGEQERLQVVLVPWSCTARWRMPVEVWTRTIAAHFPGGGWIRLQRETLDELARCKAERGHHSFDDTVRGLLEGT